MLLFLWLPVLLPAIINVITVSYYYLLGLLVTLCLLFDIVHRLWFREMRSLYFPYSELLQRALLGFRVQGRRVWGLA